MAHALWMEWVQGLGSSLSIEWLERKQGVTWKKVPAGTFFSSK
jgi:hypothetical protein